MTKRQIVEKLQEVERSLRAGRVDLAVMNIGSASTEFERASKDLSQILNHLRGEVGTKK